MSEIDELSKEQKRHFMSSHFFLWKGECCRTCVRSSFSQDGMFCDHYGIDVCEEELCGAYKSKFRSE